MAKCDNFAMPRKLMLPRCWDRVDPKSQPEQAARYGAGGIRVFAKIHGREDSIAIRPSAKGTPQARFQAIDNVPAPRNTGLGQRSYVSIEEPGEILRLLQDMGRH